MYSHKPPHFPEISHAAFAVLSAPDSGLRAPSKSSGINIKTGASAQNSQPVRSPISPESVTQPFCSAIRADSALQGIARESFATPNAEAMPGDINIPRNPLSGIPTTTNQ